MECPTGISCVLAKCEGFWIKTRRIIVEESTCSVWLQRRASALEHRYGYRGGSPVSSNLDDDCDDDDDKLPSANDKTIIHQ